MILAIARQSNIYGAYKYVEDIFKFVKFGAFNNIGNNNLSAVSALETV